MGKVLNQIEADKVRRVIESCKTGEQLNLASDWVERICADSTQRFLILQMVFSRWACFGRDNDYGSTHRGPNV